MKKISFLLAVLLIVAFGVFALGSGESETADQGKDKITVNTEVDKNTELGDYSVIIDSCRLAKDFENKNVVIVKYIFTNNSNDTPTAFFTAFDDTVYQKGVSLNNAFVLKDSAKYRADNQTKKIKKGKSINVEVAYELNNIKSDIEVEVKELFSFNDKTLTKKFSINL